MTLHESVRVLLLSPSLDAGGNATSARSLAAALPRHGVLVRTLDVAGPGFRRRLREALRSFRPDLVHALHARKGGAAFLDAAPARRPPLVVSLTGTDMFEDPKDPALRREVVRALRCAERVISDGRAMAAAAVDLDASIRDRLVVTPPGVDVLARGDARAGRERMGVGPRAQVFLLPAGLRPVKDPLFALGPLGRLQRRRPDIMFVHCGEVRDAATGKAMTRAARDASWVRTLGEVPRKFMGDLLAAATVVLNTSRSEGLSNVIGEAQAAGRAVLASDIPANAELIEDGVDGLLYTAGSERSFSMAAERLLADAGLRRRLGAAARRASKHRDPAEEAKRIAEVYRSVSTPVRAAASRRRPRG
jgi:glycosyltransferase involved in cell wall biosynthesis